MDNTFLHSEISLIIHRPNQKLFSLRCLKKKKRSFELPRPFLLTLFHKVYHSSVGILSSNLDQLLRGPLKLCFLILWGRWSHFSPLALHFSTFSAYFSLPLLCRVEFSSQSHFRCCFLWKPLPSSVKIWAPRAPVCVYFFDSSCRLWLKSFLVHVWILHCSGHELLKDTALSFLPLAPHFRWILRAYHVVWHVADTK